MRRNIRRFVPTVLSAGGPKISTWYVNDTFSTDDAAPLGSPRTAEPGPGSWTVAENDGELSISGGALNLPDQATAALGDLMLVGASGLTRAAGLAMATRATATESGNVYLCGFLNDPAGNATSTFDELVHLSSSIAIRSAEGDLAKSITIANHTNTAFKYAVILRAAGAFFVRDGQLFAVNNAANAATVYPNIQAYTAVSTLDYAKIGQLGGPWLDTYGPGALHTSGSIAASTAFTHEANCLIYFTVTNRGTAGSSIIKFRVQDASNYWKLTIASDGSADLTEVVAGAETSRGTAVAGVFTNGERGYISCGFDSDNKIGVGDSAAERINYTSATNFATATSGVVATLATDAVLSNLEIYPVDLSGAALAWVEALEAGPTA